MSKMDILNKIKTKVVIYNELKNVRNIEQILDEFGHCVLLYLTSHNYGHWVAIIRHEHSIEVFDSYGIYKPDDELDTVKNRRELGQSKNYLSILLLKTGMPIEWNDNKFQRAFSTCGRWCCLRIIFNNLNIDDFIDKFGNITDKMIATII